MGFFLMMFLFFVFMRIMSHGRRHHFVRMHYQRGHYQHRFCRQPFNARHVPVVETQKPQPNAYERLKRRYVDGDIDVEQYERELDELLRSPEAKRFVN